MTMYDDSRVVTLLREIDTPLGPPDRLRAVQQRARRQESRRASALATVMAVVLIAGVVSALNLGDRSKTEVLTVAGAANATVDAGTARVTMKLTFSGPAATSFGGSGGYTLSGPVDFRHQRFAMKGRFMGETLELRGIGRDRWTSQSGIPGRKWSHTTDRSKGNGFEQVDPARLLSVLTSKGEQVSRKQVGDRTVFVLRVPADVLTPGAPTEGGPEEVTVAVDEAGLVRTLEMTSEPDTTVEIKIRMSYDDFGIDVDVRPPPADEVQEESTATGSSQSSSESFTVGSSSSPEDRKRTCDMLREFLAQQPTPKTDQEKEQRRRFEQAYAQSCSKG
jgi:hypothetical protein